MKAKGKKASDPLLRVIAWSAVMVASALPTIIWRESGHGRAPWLALTQCVLLVLGALAVLPFPRVRVLSRFLLALAAMRIGWYFASPWIEGTGLFRRWSESGNWNVRLLSERITVVAGAFLMSLTLIGSGMTRRDLFLCRGNLAALAQPIPFLGLRKPIPWTVFGPGLLVIFGVALPLFLYFTVHPDFTASGRILHFLPWILLIAALNAANEEFQFRNVLLAHLRNAVSPAEAVLLTAVLFGLGHYYGQPSGPIGVVMAGFAGWIWARSMIETRGSAWAFFIHMAQDIVIFSFLAVAAAK
ncbi:MAG: protease family protein [Verrucomicrobiota bacterium]|jgi:membrane protease YdiL (CAAX protease family)